MFAVADIESDGLLYSVTQAWCLCFKDSSGTEYSYTGDKILDGLKHLNTYDVVVFHNGYGYDLPLVDKLYGFKFTTKVHDTFIMSSLFRPDIGKHGIEAWGQRFGMKKVEHEDWSQFSDEMLNRCVEDVRICYRVYETLLKDMNEYDWNSSLRLEYKMASIASLQEQNGVKVDLPLIQSLILQIDKERRDIEEYVLPLIPASVSHKFAVVSKPFTQAGSHSKNVIKWFGEDSKDVVAPFNKVEFHKINLRSSTQVKDYLISVGWRPTQWNFKTDKDGRGIRDDRGNPVKSSPKLTEDSYGSVVGDIPSKISRLMILNHRRSMLVNEGRGTGWVNKIRSDGRIAAEGVPQGTPTGRYRHRTVVNVPKAREDIPFGIAFRGIFTVEDGYMLLGSDAAALEARIEAHYTYPYDDGAYARELMEGDIHTANASVFNVSRDLAKNGKYALTYGAQAGKLAETLGKSKKESVKLFDSFWESNSALSSLRNDVIKAWETKGYVIGLDGRKLFCRSAHGALNYLFQSAGSIVVKTATCYMNNRLYRSGVEFKQVLHMHDEVSFEIKEKDYEQIKKIVEASWIDAGEYWKLNIPIEGDVQLGKTWADVH